MASELEANSPQENPRDTQGDRLSENSRGICQRYRNSQQKRCPHPQGASRSIHTPGSHWLAQPFRRDDEDGQRVWKSGRNGSGGGFDPFRGGLSTPRPLGSILTIHASNSGDPLLKGIGFPTFPTRETSVRFLGNPKKLRKIQCLLIIQIFGQIRKPPLYPFELWGQPTKGSLQANAGRSKWCFGAF